MNICMLSFETIFSKRGGVETYVHQLSRHFANDGHKVFVVSRSTDSYRNFVVNGVHYITVPLKTFNIFLLQLYSVQMLLFTFKAAIEIKKLSHTHRLDIVHAQFCCGFFYALLRRITWDRTKFVVTLHGTLVDEQLARTRKSVSSYLLILMEYLSVKLANGIIASSHDTLRSARRHYNIGKTKNTVIYSGVELERFDLKKTDQEAKKQWSDTFNVLYVGNAAERKRIHLLLQAAAMLIPKYKNLRFFLVGQGTEQCFSHLNNQTFRRFFVCAGTVSEETLTKYYLMSDVFVLPSLYEGFGLVVVEAFAAGKPVIAFDAGSLPELVENGKNGFLLDASNGANELACSIEKLMKNDALRMEMGHHAKETAKKFTWKKSGYATINFYRTLM